MFRNEARQRGEVNYNQRVCSCDQSSPLGEGHLDVVAGQQRSVGELKLKHLPFIILILILGAWWVCQDVVDPALLARL